MLKTTMNLYLIDSKQTVCMFISIPESNNSWPNQDFFTCSIRRKRWNEDIDMMEHSDAGHASLSLIR